jgi:hypothetical protein
MSGFELGLDSVSGTIAATGAGAKLQRGTGDEELSLELSTNKQMTKFVDSLETWDLNPQDITLGKEIGRGAYGVVYGATLRGQNVAVKSEFDFVMVCYFVL